MTNGLEKLDTVREDRPARASAAPERAGREHAHGAPERANMHLERA